MKPVSAASLGRIQCPTEGVAATGSVGNGRVFASGWRSPSPFSPASCNAMMAVKNWRDAAVSQSMVCRPSRKVRSSPGIKRASRPRLRREASTRLLQSRSDNTPR